MSVLEDPLKSLKSFDVIDLEEALSILKEAVEEHERTWGPVESHQGDEDWTTRAVALLSKRERRH